MKKRDNGKKGLILGFLLTLIVSLSAVTFSRYISEITANATVQVAKWSVTLNETDMQENSVLTVNATDVSNPNVASGKIAPGKSIQFNFDLNPAGSEVAIDYTFSLGEITNLANENSDIAITSVTAKIGETGNTSEISPDSDGNYKISETLAQVTANNIVHVVVTVTWNDDEGTNAADTANGITGNTLTIQVPITAEQHIS